MAENAVLIGADLSFHGEDLVVHLFDQSLPGNNGLAVKGQGRATMELPAAVKFIGNALAEHFIVWPGNTTVQFHIFTVFSVIMETI